MRISREKRSVDYDVEAQGCE